MNLTVSSLWKLSLAVSGLALGGLVAVERALTAGHAPGIVAFELCAYRDACAAIVDAWGPRGGQLAAFSLGLDYLFLLAYSAALSLGLLWAAARVPPRMSASTRAAAHFAWSAGVADAYENFCLLRVLEDPSDGGTAFHAALAATFKFGVVIVALAWLLVALGAAQWARRRAS